MIFRLIAPILKGLYKKPEGLQGRTDESTYPCQAVRCLVASPCLSDHDPNFRSVARLGMYPVATRLPEHPLYCCSILGSHSLNFLSYGFRVLPDRFYSFNKSRLWRSLNRLRSVEISSFSGEHPPSESCAGSSYSLIYSSCRFRCFAYGFHCFSHGLHCPTFSAYFICFPLSSLGFP